MERTLILVKPDAFARRLAGEIIGRFERRGLEITALKLMHVDRATAEQHYEEHRGKDFFDPLVEFMTEGPIVAMVIEGREAIATARTTIGPTDPVEATPGSIRGDFGLEVRRNLAHASDSAESADREIGNFFPELG